MHASLNELLSLRDEVVSDSEVLSHVQTCAECQTELTRLRTMTSALRGLSDRWPVPDCWAQIQQKLGVPSREDSNNLSDYGTTDRQFAAAELQHPAPAGRVEPVVTHADERMVMHRAERAETERSGQPHWPLRESQASDGAAHSTKVKHPSWRWPVAVAAAVLGTVVLLNWRSDGVRESSERAARVSSLQEDAQLLTARRSLIAESRQLEQLLATLPDNRAVVRAGTALTLADLQDQIRWVDYRLSLSEEVGLYPNQSEQLWRERVDLLNSLVAVRYAQARTSF